MEKQAIKICLIIAILALAIQMIMPPANTGDITHQKYTENSIAPMIGPYKTRSVTICDEGYSYPDGAYRSDEGVIGFKSSSTKLSIELGRVKADYYRSSSSSKSYYNTCTLVKTVDNIKFPLNAEIDIEVMPDDTENNVHCKGIYFIQKGESSSGENNKLFSFYFDSGGLNSTSNILHYLVGNNYDNKVDLGTFTQDYKRHNLKVDFPDEKTAKVYFDDHLKATASFPFDMPTSFQIRFGAPAAANYRYNAPDPMEYDKGFWADNIKITVEDTDSDGDEYYDSIDAFPNDRHEWADTDGDGTGDNEDPDDDGDGMSDYWEERYGLDPLDPSDADQDKDSDGFSNLEEYQAGTDPCREDRPPMKKESKEAAETTAVGGKSGTSGYIICLSIGIIAFIILVIYLVRNAIIKRKKSGGKASQQLVKGSKAPPPKQKTMPIAILGGGGSGKTVFFAMLSKVLGGGQYSKMWIEYDEGLGYLKDIRNSLDHGEWPAKTFVGVSKRFTARVYEKLALGTKIHNLIMNDIAGEDFERTFDPNIDVTTVPGHLSHIPHSRAYIWVIDPTRANEDWWRYYKLMQYLIKVRGLGPTKQLKEPIAVVFTKYDKYRQILSNAEGFARDNFGDLYPMLKRRTKHLAFFTVSAIGEETPDGKPRLPLAPHGVGEVIEWVLNPKKVTQSPPVYRDVPSSIHPPRFEAPNTGQSIAPPAAPPAAPTGMHTPGRPPERAYQPPPPPPLEASPFPRQQQPLCPVCNGPLTFVSGVQQWFCNECRRYRRIQKPMHGQSSVLQNEYVQWQE